MYYLQSRYYNPEWGRFINADGIIGQTGELLGHNLFAYSKNNPVNMGDPSGFGPKFDTEEENEYYSWKRSQRGTLSTHSTNSLNYNSSALKAGMTGLSDTLTGKAVNALIKEKMVWKSFGYLAMGSFVSDLNKAGKFNKVVLSMYTTIGICAWDVGSSLGGGEYFGAGIDIVSTLAGVGAGAMIAAGTAALITASTPVLIAGGIYAGGFILNTAISVGIDYVSSSIKDKHYRR